MKKKIAFIGIGLFMTLVAAAFIIPVIFKEDIKKLIDEQIAASVNADVKYDINNFDLSLFRHFPSVTAEMKELSVYNRAPFEGLPLFQMKRFEIEVNLMELIFSGQIRIKGISLIEPRITVRVTKDGQANYDIAIPSADTTAVAPAEEEPSKFSFGIDHWEIVNGMVDYQDESMPVAALVKGLAHKGSGDFNEKQFDLVTATSIDSLSVNFGGIEYLSNKQAQLDMTLDISESFSKYAFKENKLRLNDFAMQMQGWLKMNEKNMDMDVSFSSPDNTFKSLLSLVPGVYTKDFKDIETKGDLAFKGFLKGVMDDNRLPAFNMELAVKDAMFKYPKLPTAVNNINMNLLVDNATGVIKNTVVDLKKLHLDFGSNPVDCRALIKNLYNYDMDASLETKVNLAEVTKIFPVDSLELKGIYELRAKAQGVYDSAKKIIPSIDADMKLTGGYVKSLKFPAPIENLVCQANVKNVTGKMAETAMTVTQASMVLEGEKFEASGVFRNLDDYAWDLKAKGGLDLEKITKIFPLEGMQLAGKINADIATKGKFSDVQAKRFERIPTSGTVDLQRFKYVSKDLPQPVTIETASSSFDPAKIELKNMKGTIGNSDFAAQGELSNYIAYVFGKGIIKGNLNVNSNMMDLNQFMTASTPPPAAPVAKKPAASDTAKLEAIQIPENIDFVLRANMKTVKMMDYVMTNATGDIIVKNGMANMNGLKFNMLGGEFITDGTYQAKDKKHPKYDLKLKIDNVAVSEIANSFSVVKTYVPIAGIASGNFSTDFAIKGELKQDMMPNLETVSGAGLVKIAQAAIKQSKLISGITSLTKLNNTDQVSLKDALLSASIDDGKLSVKPFDIKIGDYKTTVTGSSTLSGGLNYSLKMNIPAGQLGDKLGELAGKSLGAGKVIGEIPITIGVGGTITNPKFQLLASEQKEQVKEAVKAKAQDAAKSAIEGAMQGKNAKEIIGGLLGGQKKETAQDTSKKAEKPTKPTEPAKAIEEIGGAIKGLFNKRK